MSKPLTDEDLRSAEAESMVVGMRPWERQLIAEIRTLRARVKVLEGLQDFAKHDFECDCSQDVGSKCSCGLAELNKALDGEEGKE